MPEQKRKYKLADFVSKIVKDPNAPPNTLLLQGYLGESSDEGHVRLYLDPQLSDYVEIPEDAILHTQEVPNATLGETYVWINQDAELTHGKAGPQRLKAKFLEGRLQQQFLGGAAAAAAPQPAAPVATPPFTVFPQQCLPPSIGIACIPSLVPIHCPTHAPLLCPISVPIFHCRSIQIPCITQSPAGCHSILTPCISQNVACPTQTPALCPVASGAIGCGPIGPGPQGPGPELMAAAAVARPIPSAQPGICVTGDFAPCPTQNIAQCPSAVDACPTRACPTQIIAQCPSAIDACPTMVRGCQSIQPGICVTGDFVPCPTQNVAQCPSAIDACPTQRGCQSVPVLQCPSQIIIQCPSAVCASGPPCHTVPVLQCPSAPPVVCATVIGNRCPSVACPSIRC